MTPEANAYEYQDQEVHYLLIALEEETDIQRVKASVDQYLRASYPDLRYRITSFSLTAEEKSVVMLRRFSDASSAVKLYRAMQIDRNNVFESVDSATIYPIGHTNYQRLLDGGSLQEYDAFFKSRYL